MNEDKPSHYHVSLAGTHFGSQYKTREEAERVAYRVRHDLNGFKRNKLRVSVIKCACG